MNFTTILLFIGFVILLFLFLYFFLKPSPTGVYHCLCQVPEYGEKEVIVTVQVQGETWGAKILQPTNLTLNIFGYSVPCSCKTP